MEHKSGATTPVVSIILPAFNSVRFLESTLCSIYAQSFQDFEVLLVDDGSTDETAAVVSSQYPQVRLFRQANAGISQARNTGLQSARGKYIAFMDHDDFWHPQKLEVQVRLLDEAPASAGACYGEFHTWDGTSTPSFPADLGWPPRLVPELSGWIYHELLLTNWVLFSTVLFKREVFAAVGEFDPDLPPADDWDIALRVSRRFQFLKMQDVVALYRTHAAQTSRRCFPRDHQSDLRESMLLRYGPKGPDGRASDPRKLLDRRIRSHLAYCFSHAELGSIPTALRALGRAWRLSPASARTWRAGASVLVTLARRVPGLVTGSAKRHIPTGSRPPR
jgi:glycosyltransferase involved in cell wall biosynthesis